MSAATQPLTSGGRSPGGESMPRMGRHAPRRDHLWVLAIIAGFAFYDVWVSWTQLGNEAGFPHGTGWTLTVIVELYWGYALYAWLAGAPGPRSRRFAMCSAIGVFALSLAGQGSSYLAVGRTPPVPVEVFVHLLPVTVLALLAFLIHFRHLDRAEAGAAERRATAEREHATAEAVAADDRTALRAELEASREALRVTETARDFALREAATATAKADALTRNSRQKKPARSPGTRIPRDVSARAEALAILSDKPGISGAELGEKLGKSERWGQLRKKEFAGSATGPDTETP